VDLLGFISQEAGDTDKADQLGLREPSGWKTAALLLARVFPPPAYKSHAEE
jgi:hypothetical protein